VFVRCPVCEGKGVVPVAESMMAYCDECRCEGKVWDKHHMARLLANNVSYCPVCGEWLCGVCDGQGAYDPLDGEDSDVLYDCPACDRVHECLNEDV
jgi:DnaJ-class molecular chaperone